MKINKVPRVKASIVYIYAERNEVFYDDVVCSYATVIRENNKLKFAE